MTRRSMVACPVCDSPAPADDRYCSEACRADDTPTRGLVALQCDGCSADVTSTGTFPNADAEFADSIDPVDGWSFTRGPVYWSAQCARCADRPDDYVPFCPQCGAETTDSGRCDNAHPSTVWAFDPMTGAPVTR